jgi:hypothetical protein
MNCDWCGKDIPLAEKNRRVLLYHVTLLNREMIICYFCKRMAEDYARKGERATTNE